MQIRANAKRICNFVIKRRRELGTVLFWKTVARVIRERFDYFNRVSHTEFLENLRQIEMRPWNLHVELTNICNSDCIFCAYRHQTRTQAVMSPAIYSKAIGDYCAIGGGELRLESCVGDPLVDPHFIDRVKEARSHPEIAEIITLTNGINLDRVGIDDLLTCGIDAIHISTGPWREDLYRQVFRNACYDTMRANVTALLRANAVSGRPVRAKVLFRSHLTMKETFDLPDYRSIRDLPHEVEFNTDFDTWLGYIKQDDLLAGMHLRPHGGMPHEACYWLYDGPIVFADGSVGLCGCRDFNADSELIVGHIRRSSLLEIWRSEAARTVRKRFLQGKIPGICARCTSYANLDLYRTKRGSARSARTAARFTQSSNKKMRR